MDCVPKNSVEGVRSNHASTRAKEGRSGRGTSQRSSLPSVEKLRPPHWSAASRRLNPSRSRFSAIRLPMSQRSRPSYESAGGRGSCFLPLAAAGQARPQST